MAFFKIKTNAIEAGILAGCISASSGSRGQNLAKDDFLSRFLEAWPEIDSERDDVGRIDDKAAEAKETREFEMDTIEQGVLAECFLVAVKPDTTTGARFRLFRRAAKLIQVSEWFTNQTREKLAPFAGKADNQTPTHYSDPVPAADA